MIWFVRWQLHQFNTYTRRRAILLNLVKLISKIIICGARAQCTQIIKVCALYRDRFSCVILETMSNRGWIHCMMALPSCNGPDWSLLLLVSSMVRLYGTWHSHAWGGDTSGRVDTACMLLIFLELCGFGGRGGGRGPYSGQLFVKRVYLLLHRLNLLCNHSKNIQS